MYIRGFNSLAAVFLSFFFMQCLIYFPIQSHFLCHLQFPACLCSSSSYQAFASLSLSRQVPALATSLSESSKVISPAMHCPSVVLPSCSSALPLPSPHLHPAMSSLDSVPIPRLPIIPVTPSHQWVQYRIEEPLPENILLPFRQPPGNYQIFERNTDPQAQITYTQHFQTRPPPLCR
jgi:hypothetical protein